LSKVNAIRKKALEHVRKQNWLGAIKEYTRLADLDQSNPNVFNELGDIYLKTGNKNDAYDAFSRAIDSYTLVSLHNNAVAVCKKVLRLIPARYEVLTKLGLIRKKQGLGKEAESYYSSYLDKLLIDQSVRPADVTQNCAEVADEMGESLPVLKKAYNCMIKFNLKDETGDILQKLYTAYDKSGDEAGGEETRQRMQELGMKPVVQPETDAIPDSSKDGVVITEDNIWSAVHTEGERIEVDAVETLRQGSPPIGAPDARPGTTRDHGAPETGNASGDARSEAAATSTETLPDPSDNAQQVAPESGRQVYDITPEPEAPAPSGTESRADAPDANAPPTSRETATEEPVTGSQDPHGLADPAAGGNVHVSAIIGDAGSDEGEMTEDDHRSHYDLGMAYLEMDLMAEAIREFQLASKSDTYQSRALEMIGLCFLKQNLPNLAVKQLTRGLQMIGPGETEALGIKYNLGLAYEMVGDVEKALSAFEDVYVEDVTFRDVAEKIEKYS
jgi:tetratricopeptide (TPR) repeat protein